MKLTWSFNFTFGYINAVLSPNNSKVSNHFYPCIPFKLEIVNDTTCTDMSASYIVLTYKPSVIVVWNYPFLFSVYILVLIFNKISLLFHLFSFIYGVSVHISIKSCGNNCLHMPAQYRQVKHKGSNTMPRAPVL